MVDPSKDTIRQFFDERYDYADEFNIIARLEGWERDERLIKQQVACDFRAIMQPSHALAILDAAEQLSRDMAYVAREMKGDSEGAFIEYYLNALSAYSRLGKDNIEEKADEAAYEDWMAEGWDEVEDVLVELAYHARIVADGVKALRKQIEERVCYAER